MSNIDVEREQGGHVDLELKGIIIELKISNIQSSPRVISNFTMGPLAYRPQISKAIPTLPSYRESEAKDGKSESWMTPFARFKRDGIKSRRKSSLFQCSSAHKVNTTDFGRRNDPIVLAAVGDCQLTCTEH
jgi:hypothetical protein